MAGARAAGARKERLMSQFPRSPTAGPRQLPSSYRAMHEQCPQLMAAYEKLGQACSTAGPLDRKTVSLVKLAISASAGLEGGVHSHTRKALQAGCTRDELLHVVYLLTPTIGFPTMMRARSWVLDVTDEAPSEKAPESPL